jgi:hypothetical protein
MKLSRDSCIGIISVVVDNGAIMCKLTTSHTYTTPGVYTAIFTPYIARLYNTPRCEIPQQRLATATIAA